MRGFKRIVIVGASGSGKTTLAQTIASRFGHDHIELDAHHWGPDWTERGDAVVRAELDHRTDEDRWVLDGNYSRYHDITWTKADTVLWLDYPRPLVMSRVVRRTMRRIVTREKLWGHNRETLSKALSRDSIVVWSFTTWHALRRRYQTKSTASDQVAHLMFVRLPSPRDTASFIDGLPT